VKAVDLFERGGWILEPFESMFGLVVLAMLITFRSVSYW